MDLMNTLTSAALAAVVTAAAAVTGGGLPSGPTPTAPTTTAPYTAPTTDGPQDAAPTTDAPTTAAPPAWGYKQGAARDARLTCPTVTGDPVAVSGTVRNPLAVPALYTVTWNWTDQLGAVLTRTTTTAVVEPGATATVKASGRVDFGTAQCVTTVVRQAKS